MGFFGFILFGFLFLVLIIVVRVVLAVLRMRNGLKNLFSGGSRQRSRRDPGRSDGHGYSKQWAGSGQKVYAKDEGEYVSFEEIIVDDPLRHAGAGGRRTIRREDRIVDAEYEDI